MEKGETTFGGERHDLNGRPETCHKVSSDKRRGIIALSRFPRVSGEKQELDSTMYVPSFLTALDDVSVGQKRRYGCRALVDAMVNGTGSSLVNRAPVCSLVP